MVHPSQLARSTDPVTNFLASVKLAPRQAYKSLTVWPLVRRDDAPPLAGPSYEPIAGALVTLVYAPRTANFPDGVVLQGIHV